MTKPVPTGADRNAYISDMETYVRALETSLSSLSAARAHLASTGTVPISELNDHLDLVDTVLVRAMDAIKCGDDGIAA